MWGALWDSFVEVDNEDGQPIPDRTVRHYLRYAYIHSDPDADFGAVTPESDPHAELWLPPDGAEPIEFGAVPADGEQITAEATGELTLRGVTNPVTFDLVAQTSEGRIGVLGDIPVVFADYEIPNPSFGTISTEDNGLLEFVLVFDAA